MARDHRVSRRTAVKLAGAAASTALVAGCSGGNGGDDDGSGDDGSGDGSGDDGGNGGADEYEAEPGDEITFEGATTEWTGLTPSAIEGASNPTLILEEGETYTIGWTEGNGTPHNIEIRNGDDEVVGDYETEQVPEPGDDQLLEVEATAEMAAYVCNPHPDNMRGEIQIE